MKKLKYIAALCLLFCGTICFAQDGISFQQDKKWADVVAKAKAENKLLFVDVYTSWCGPCKLMEKEVFTQKAVGDKFNPLFINYKLDAEKGEGPAIALNYRVNSYPTYLFVNGDGILIYKSTSSMSGREFIGVANNALSEAKQQQTIIQLDELYPTKKADTLFMYNYLVRRTTLRLDNADLLDEYIALMPENQRGEIKNLQLILDNGNFFMKSVQLGLALETLGKNKDKFGLLKQKYGESLDGIVSNAANVSLRKAINTKNEQLLQQVLTHYEAAANSTFSDNKETVYLEYYYSTGEDVKYLNAAKKYVNNFLLKLPLDTLQKMDKGVYDYFASHDKNQNDPELSSYKHTQTIQLTNMLSRIAKNFMGLPFASPADLKMAQKWVGHALDIANSDKDYYKNVLPVYTEIDARLLYKTGNKQSAIAMIQNVDPGSTDNQFAPLVASMKAGQELQPMAGH